MSYQLTPQEAAALFQALIPHYTLFAPRQFPGEGCFSDIPVTRYTQITTPEEIDWDKKSDYSYKEALLPINEPLFYFTENETTIPKAPDKDILIFLRACDLNAVKRLDEIYLKNGFEDYYYARIRSRAKFILMECSSTCDSGFCVSMGTNRAENYDAWMKKDGGVYYIDAKDETLASYLKSGTPADADLSFVEENKEKVTLPRNLSNESFTNEIWQEYGARCIGCGRCNFVCPTCTCFTMQDIFYKDNPKSGERRRVWASCQVDGFTDMAGGHSFRKSQGDRLRFKVMHKIHDYEKRTGYPMCVGCGRCDDVCPEYISYSNLVNRLSKEEMAAASQSKAEAKEETR